MERTVLTIWRRHTESCPHKDKGRNYLKCSCPIWADGYNNGRREFRKSLKTGDMARARKRAAELEDPNHKEFKPIEEAIEAFLLRCQGDGLSSGTYRKYQNSLNHLKAFCVAKGMDTVRELDIEAIDAFRLGRKLKAITAQKELQLLRQFCEFCRLRKWIAENHAKSIKGPKNIDINDKEPYTSQQVSSIIAAAKAIGQQDYERKRALAMVMVLRYTALRIGDVAMLHRDRISADGQRWRIFLRTAKNGKPIFLSIPAELKEALDAVPAPRGSKDDWPYYFWNGISTERSMKKNIDDTLRSVFRKSSVARAHAHRFRHTLATELLGYGATFEEVADILGNTPEIVRKHYAKWSVKRQERIDELMGLVHQEATYIRPKLKVVK